MRRMVILGLLLFAGIFMFLTDCFVKKKKSEYKNDERWQQIKLKVNSIVLKYFNILAGAICIGMIYFDAFVLSAPVISVVRVLYYAFLLVMLRYPVEYFALRYYDGKL